MKRRRGECFADDPDAERRGRPNHRTGEYGQTLRPLKHRNRPGENACCVGPETIEPMNRTAFLKLLTLKLFPVLKAEGFEGSGQTLRRIDGPLIHVFNVQAASGGKACYLNLGAHLDFLPTEGGAQVEPDAMEESHCVFRDRMDPPPGPAFGWAYGATQAQAQETVEFIVSEWAGPGRAFFARHGRYPQSFEQMLRDTDPNLIHARTALHLARIAEHLGDRERAKALVDAGLARAPERATGLKADLAKVLAG
jgi:hypothetical protein